MSTPETERPMQDMLPTAQLENSDVEWRRVGLFVLFTFGISWSVAAVIYATGGIGAESPEVFAGIRLWYVLTPTAYMFAPAAANVLTRLATGEGRESLSLRPHFRRNWRWWIVAWVAPPLLVYLGAMLFFTIFPQFLGVATSTLNEALSVTADQTGGFSPQELVLVTAVAALTINTAVNCVATFGEEFGWRAYLLPKLLDLGGRQAVLLTGVIWGVWHWPLIWMGYNYPGRPVLGILAMVYFTVVAGVFLGWVTLRGKSVWPAVIGHAAINANAGIVLLLARNDPSRLLGPSMTGVIGSLPLLVLALWLLRNSGTLALREF